MIRFNLSLVIGAILIFDSSRALLSHFTPSQLIKDFIRRSKSGNPDAPYELSHQLIDAVESCPPGFDKASCEKRANLFREKLKSKLDRETLNNKARAVLLQNGISPDYDINKYPTVNLVSLLRTTPRIGEMAFPKNKFELKTKDVASVLKFKKLETL
ncbi:unnamed protein product [Anisakis simplex]|uniref:Uncharacterized protein n=1 Tax=Anisakis simplex TaxID=6269 RepID=A0A0M3K7Z0_ANISI|nr:unnamed protein product [Anisakis simplex]